MATKEKQIKSRERVEAHGEVFTAEREVKAMCDLVKTETERIDSRFLEPACGDGNFLIEILTRKLDIVKKKYRRSSFDYERMSLLALGSLYGVDILNDNAIACRKRLYDFWDEQYKAVCKKECNEDTRHTAQFILERNIVCGNALTLRCVDDQQQDTEVPIVFSEWSFPRNDAFMRRKDYTFDELLNGQQEPVQEKETVTEPDLFGYSDKKTEKNHDAEDGSHFVCQFVSHYRRIWEHA